MKKAFLIFLLVFSLLFAACGGEGGDVPAAEDGEESKTEDKTTTESEVTKPVKTRDSFYKKLAQGGEVNVLLVGDLIAAGSGASDGEKSFAQLTAKLLSEKYGAAISVVNVSMGGNSSYAGYVRVRALESTQDFDLALLCYGQNDDEADFGLYYEAMIRAVQSSFPNSDVIAILESSQRTYTPKIKRIKALAEHYGFPVVDMIAPFAENYDALVKDGVHPNDAGHALYAEKITELIGTLADEGRAADPAGVEAVDGRVESFSKFRFYPREMFSRSGNTYTCPCRAKADVAGIDYYYMSGHNSCRVYFDGKLVASPETDFNYNFNQRRIVAIKQPGGKTVVAESEIKVVFPETDEGRAQADNFAGIAISGK